eukprot:c27210_g1_i1 orf=96-248(+)
MHGAQSWLCTERRELAVGLAVMEAKTTHLDLNLSLPKVGSPTSTIYFHIE